jgi:peptide/nickel transport system substrate-binding protein
VISLTRRLPLFLGAFATGLLTLVACDSEPQKAPAKGQDQGKAPAVRGDNVEDGKDSGDTLVWAVMADADGFLPTVASSATGGAMMDLMMPSVTESGFSDGRLSFTPGWARAWEFSKDKKQLTLHFKEGLTWDDGQPLTAHDLAFAYDLIGNAAANSPRRPYMDNMVEGEPYTVLDDYTIRFNYQWAYNPQTMMAHAGMNPVPKHLLKDADPSQLRKHDLHIKMPVGHGPFRLLDWKRGQALRITRNPACKIQKVPYIQRIEARVIKEYATQMAELKKGGVDLMEGLQIRDIDEVRSYPHINVYRRGYRFMDYIAWNQTNPLFEDRRVRRALTMSLDIPKFIRSYLTTPEGEVTALPAYATITPELTDYKEDDFPLLPFDTKKAKELLAEAGWKDTDDDGILDREGSKFVFTLLTNSGNNRRKNMGVFVKAELAKVGIHANLEYIESTTFFGKLREKDYEAAIGGWSAGLFPDPAVMWMTATEAKPRAFNQTGYSNPEADEIMKEMRRSSDLEKEQKLMKRLLKIIYEDQPYTFLFWRAEYFALHKRFRGVKPNVLSVLYQIQDWWVPKGEQKYKY